MSAQVGQDLSIATGTEQPSRQLDPEPGCTVDENLPRHLFGSAASVKVAGAVLLAGQLLAILVLSVVEYRRYALNVGFGTYAQAWTAIGSGHLDPFSSFIRAPFWQNDAEFILWPLALLYRVYPHPIDLLVVQDVALVATEAVAFAWILEVLWSHSRTRATVVGGALAWGSLGVLAVDPFAFETAAYDFHTEVLAALFVVLTGRALWRGTFGQLWVWVPLALGCLALASTYVVALGISALFASRGTRRVGAALVLVGAGYLLVLGTVDARGFGLAHSLAGLYGYLVGPHHGVVSPAQVVLGALGHPWAAISMILRRWYLLFDFFIVFGLVGLWSVWAWPVVVAVMLPSALSAQVAFLNPSFSFQSWPAFMFLLVGTVIILQRLVVSEVVGIRNVRFVGSIWAVGLVVLTLALVPTVPSRWLPVRPDSASALARLDATIPRGDEVIASGGIVGRFGVRPDVYPYGPLSVLFPVDRPRVYFVIVPGQGNFEVRSTSAVSAVRFIEVDLHSRIVFVGHDVYGLEWTPPPVVDVVHLPGPGSKRGFVSTRSASQTVPNVRIS